jgi:hypothetical protein
VGCDPAERPAGKGSHKLLAIPDALHVYCVTAIVLDCIEEAALRSLFKGLKMSVLRAI